MKTGIAMSVVLAGVFSLTGCAITKTYILRNPTASAKLLQTWHLDDFTREIESNEKVLEKYYSGSGTELAFPPVFVIPFGTEELKELRCHAEKDDLVLWYSDRWLDLEITYICLQRGGRIIWTFKRLEQRHGTLANQISLPMRLSVTPRACARVAPASLMAGW